MSIVLAGQIYGELKVISAEGKDKYYHEKWKCLCSCGNTCYKYDTNLLRGRSLTCHNCRWYEKYPALYAVWQSMLARCTVSSHKAYSYYGARGITVSSSWYNSFKNFLDDMGTPETGLSLDRIDNDLGYSKENCRWATKVEQSNNRRPRKEKELLSLSPRSKRSYAAKSKEAEINWLRARNQL